MATNQLNRGMRRRLMYVESKSHSASEAPARIGWVTFSRSGRSVYYRGLTLCRVKGGGLRGNYLDVGSGDEYWVSGLKRRGLNQHWAEPIREVDEDAVNHLRRVRQSGPTDG
jgi:hypothetical protein